jgi:hypothetical protein
MAIPKEAAAAAGAISPETMAAISALSALAQAGGTGYAAYAGAEETEKARKFRDRQWLQSLQDNAETRRIDNSRYADSMANTRRAEAAASPGNSIGLLSGLSGLQQGMSRSTPIDVLGHLIR